MAASAGKGVSEKIRRANLRRKELERRVERFIDSGAYKVVRDDNVQAGKRCWIVKIHRQPPLVRWGALIGECLFDFRSALDHLAYDLAVAHTGSSLPQAVEEGSEFPIFHSRAPTQRELDKRIGAVHPDARCLIEAMQPYGRNDRAALKYLHVLHNFDKHRTLHLIVAASTGFGFFGELDFERINLGPYEDGDIAAQIALSSDPERQQDPHFTFGVAFSKTGPGAEAPDVVTTLGWIDQHIRNAVVTPLLPFL